MAAVVGPNDTEASVGRSIEHGNMLDYECAREMAQHGAFLVSTTITYHALRAEGEKAGEMGPHSLRSTSLLSCRITIWSSLGVSSDRRFCAEITVHTQITGV